MYIAWNGLFAIHSYLHAHFSLEWYRDIAPAGWMLRFCFKQKQKCKKSWLPSVDFKNKKVNKKCM